MNDAIVTQADRENDKRIDAWKARQIEASRRILVERLAQQQRDRVAACVDAYAKRAVGQA
ncbi:MAG: hypothetical protein RJA63_31 [Pseudomonadota bacterium]|jgi:hypothetical protein